jgi:tetratricopeptide (TPR) repeat protein
MAPEQHAALEAIRGGQRLPQPVDGRADVYALGLVLYEALGGPLPAPAAPAAALRRGNRRVTVGLADVVAHALDADPRRRYPSAGALAADLRRHLDDLPLRGVANRSPVEWCWKWRRRWPRALALIVLAMLTAGAGGFAAVHFGRLWQRAGASLDEGRDRMRRAEYGEAREAFRRGLDLARDVPLPGGPGRELEGQLRLAERAEAGQELHRFVERLRPLYAADGLPPAQARALERRCRALWDERGRIAERLLPQPAPELDGQVRTDMLDLALLWTDLRVRLADGPSRADARRSALRLLDEAEALFGPSCVLDRERQEHATALGLPAPAAAGPPRTAWEHYAVGRALLRAGDLDAAERHLAEALAPEPAALWPHFYHGRCAYQLGRHDDARDDFTACVLLDPGCAWCYYNRALAYTELGRAEAGRPDRAEHFDDRAAADYDRALDLDPTLAAAFLNRGMLHYRRQHFDRAAADLRRALDAGAAPAVAHYDLALVELARGDRAAALDHLRQALRDDPGHLEARALLDSLGEP